MGIEIVENLRVQESNPFYERIKPSLDTSNLAKRLMSSPLTGKSIATLSLTERHQLLDRMQEEMFEPTMTSFDVAMRMFRMVSRGLQSMDPTKASVRKFSMTLARHAGAELHSLPWFSTYAMGMTIKGPTGVGKTYEVQRVLRLIPQRIDHHASEAAGWTHMIQASWLYVPMSHDGTLGGLLFQILCSLDEAIDTTYSEDRSLTKLSNEKLAVRVGIILRKHGVGLLVMDEIQERNLGSNVRGTLAATFFLRLLNFGIPTVLLGNPFGIDVLNSFSQDLRRLGAGGSIEMHPHEPDDWDWKDCLAPAIWSFCVMPDQQDKSFMTSDVLYKYSGGIRDYACRIWTASQRFALDLGKTAVSLEDLEITFLGADFSDKERQLIAGFRDKNLMLLQQFDDIPWVQYGVKWGQLKASLDETGVNNDIPMTNSATSAEQEAEPDFVTNQAAPQERNVEKPASEKVKQAVRAKRTRQSNMTKQREDAKRDLDENDIRSIGLKKVLITGFESLSDSQD